MSNANQLALPGLAKEALEETWIDEDEGADKYVTFAHTTVMRDEIVQALAPRDGGVYVDATLGGGGHTEALLEASPGARVIALDRDARAVAAATLRLERFGARVRIVHSPFGSITAALTELGVTQVDGVCADLGVSSPQLDDADRGMSFRREGPIDMRMDQSQGETALELIARLDDDALADVIYQYGDEKRSRRIARSVKKAFLAGELHTTLNLRAAIVRAVGPVRVAGVDPATRTFQALRIKVNDELGELETLLRALPQVLTPTGVAAFLTFHSLEDKLVKQAFAVKDAWSPLGRFQVPTEDEVTVNLRSRSAKMRAARRIDPNAPPEPMGKKREREGLEFPPPMSRYQRKRQERS